MCFFLYHCFFTGTSVFPQTPLRQCHPPQRTINSMNSGRSLNVYMLHWYAAGGEILQVWNKIRIPQEQLISAKSGLIE